MSVPVLSRLFHARGRRSRPRLTATDATRRAGRRPSPGKGEGTRPPWRRTDRGSSCPALRANPCPEVTDPFCRLPLSTCSHRPEAADLGDLMRLSARLARSGPRRAADRAASLARMFKDRRRVHGRRAMCGALPTSEPYRPSSRFQGPRVVKKKRKLFPPPPPVTPGSCALPPAALRQ